MAFPSALAQESKVAAGSQNGVRGRRSKASQQSQQADTAVRTIGNEGGGQGLAERRVLEDQVSVKSLEQAGRELLAECRWGEAPAGLGSVGQEEDAATFGSKLRWVGKFGWDA